VLTVRDYGQVFARAATMEENIVVFKVSIIE